MPFEHVQPTCLAELDSLSAAPAKLVLSSDPAATTAPTNRNAVATSNLFATTPASSTNTTVWNAVHPELLVHGHMHVPGGGATKDGRRVASMGRDTQQGSLGILDMRTLRMQTPSLRDIRTAAGQS